MTTKKELQEQIEKLQEERNSILMERNKLAEQLSKKNNQLIQNKIDIIAEMKMAKMMFEIMLSGGHTHRAKEYIARLSNNVLDINIQKAEETIINKLDVNMPF